MISDKSILGPQCESDNTFTKKARLLQSIYRIECNETVCGKGPYKNSITSYGNMLDKGEQTGKNFFYNETFLYAIKRVHEKNSVETIDEYRLLNNLLSSMPMAFNLFHPLMMMKDNNPQLLNKIIKELFSELPIHEVERILIEFIPIPILKYTNDKSAMDAAIIFKDKEGDRYLIAIETKYTDALGTNKAKDNNPKYQVAIQTNLFNDEGINIIKNGCTQIYRNFLLAEKYRIVENLKDSFSILLAPKNHPSTQSEISSILKYIKPEARYKLKQYHLEEFTAIIKENCAPNNLEWIEWFIDRYLNFSKIENFK